MVTNTLLFCGTKPIPAPDAVLRGHVGDVGSVQHDTAFAHRQHAENRLHGRRLAGPVRPDDDGDLALIDGDRAGMQDVGAAIAASHVLADEVAHVASPALAGRFFSPVPR